MGRGRELGGGKDEVITMGVGSNERPGHVGFWRDSEQIFQTLEQEWWTLIETIPAKWESDFQAMETQHEELLASGEWTSGPADLLSIIGRSRRETYHSAVISWLMDPGGRHGFGDGFLERVLAACFPEGIDGNLAACKTSTEVSGATSRADIVVDGPGLHLVVEVKVDAKEGPQQCQRLFDDHHERPGARFVFLTPHGRQPQQCAQESVEAWARLSFRQVRDLVAGMVNDVEHEEAAATVKSYLATLRREFR